MKLSEQIDFMNKLELFLVPYREKHGILKLVDPILHILVGTLDEVNDLNLYEINTLLKSSLSKIVDNYSVYGDNDD